MNLNISIELEKPRGISWVDHLKDNKKHYSDAMNVLQELCNGLAEEAGWWKNKEGMDVRDESDEYFHLWQGYKLGLIHTEISEAMEGLRKNLNDDKLPQYPMLGVELQDAIIRALDLSGGLEYNAGNMFVDKLLFNATRPDHKPEARNKANGKAF